MLRMFHSALIAISVLCAIALGVAASALPEGVDLIVVIAMGTSLATLLLLMGGGVRALGSLMLIAATATVAMTAVRLSTSVALSDVFFLVGALLLLPAGVRSKGRRQNYVKVLLLGAALIVCGGLLGSLVVAANPAYSIVGLIKFTAAMTLVPLTFYAWNPGRHEVKLVYWAWILSAVASATVGVTEIGNSLLWTYTSRVDGLSLHPNALALTGVMALGPAMALALASRGSARWFAVICVILLGVGVLISGSRAGIGGGAITILTMVVFLRQWRLAFAVAVTAAALLLLLGSSTTYLPEGNALQRLLVSEEASSASGVVDSNRERRENTTVAIQNVIQHPFTGVGFVSEAIAAHNIYFQVAASGGALALLGFGIVAAASFWLPVRHVVADSVARRSADGILLMGLAAGFAGYLAVGMFHTAMWERYIWVVPAIAFVLSPYATRTSGKARTSHDPRTSPTTPSASPRLALGRT